MARRYTFCLLSGLCCFHIAFAPTSLAATPQQKHLPRQHSAQKPAIAPKVPDSKPLPSAVAQAALKKRQEVAEERVIQRAWMYSAMLPGAGQWRNGHYWKVPAFYAVFGGLLWGAIHQNEAYKQAKKRYDAEHNLGYGFQNYVQDCARTRDLCFIFAGLWYLVNIFDAYVGASLKTFTLADDIAVAVQPRLLPTAHAAPAVGVSLTLNLTK